MISIFRRVALAGGVMLAALALAGRLERPGVWRFVVVQALCLFCFNFIGLYKASGLISSGPVAVVFSLASTFNAINARVFFGDRITARTVLAGATGATGLVLIFRRDLFANFDLESVRGLAWAALGTLVFSFGNMASRCNGELGITPVTANGWGMAIGALALAALIYLALIGSIAAFTSYLVLVARIGSARAGYATVMLPVVALAVWTVVEGYQWTPLAIAGVALTLLGNVLMFWRPRPAPQAPAPAAADQ